ncbi:hypothetical protein OSTOST_04340, partial [Ostertagia ostertagi]
LHEFQVELHIYWPQHHLHDLCKKHDISVTSYGSLGSPGRVNFKAEGVKVVWQPAPSCLEDVNVKEMSKKYNKTPAQILLRYVMERNIAVIPKSVHSKRIIENFKVFQTFSSEGNWSLGSMEESKRKISF